MTTALVSNGNRLTSSASDGFPYREGDRTNNEASALVECLGCIPCWKDNLLSGFKFSAASNWFSSRTTPYLASLCLPHSCEASPQHDAATIMFHRGDGAFRVIHRAPFPCYMRDAGIQRLSHHFQWFECSNVKLLFHQEFVYDVAMFTAERGFSWANVIRSAMLAKVIFLQLQDFDINKFCLLVKDVLHEHLPDLTSVHRHIFTQYLINTCVFKRRLFQVVLGGAAEESAAQKHLEVQLPPTPCPLAQGTDLLEWEEQSQQRTKLASSLQQMEEKLRCLRAGPRVTLGDISVPSDRELDKETITELVQSAVRATEGQMVASLSQEASLLSDIHQLKLQQKALAAGGHHNTASSNKEATNIQKRTCLNKN